MVFYNTQDYLAAEARKQQAQLRGQTRSAASARGTGSEAGAVQHPPEHERARMQTLIDSIPQTLPGPNAFALRAAMAEREKWEKRERGKDKKESKQESHAEEKRPPKDDAKQEMVEVNRGLFTDHAERHREMLDAHNAYQHSIQRHRVTPLVDVHPAMRGRSLSDPPTPPRPPRDSNTTQITHFINAGWNEGEEEPKLKLKATPNPDSVPTFRGRIEDRAEEGDGEEESVPVFHPTPKIPAAKDFATSANVSTTAAQRPGTPAANAEGGGLQKEASGSKLPVKTRKKSIFSKFKLSTNSRVSLSKEDEAVQTQADGEERLPVKAQAVLGESPRKPKGRVSIGSSNNNSPTKVPRSPSKRKNFFSSVTRSSKNADVSEQQQRPQTSLSESQRPPNTPSTVVSDGPQTAISDPAHWSYRERIASLQQAGKKESEKTKADSEKTNGTGVGLGLLGRSKSLKFIDTGGVPPTPPAKNTPPHVRKEREEQETREMQDGMKVPAQRHPQGKGSEAQKDVVGTTSTNDDSTSPTRLGELGYRAAPTLVTKPSMYSMHASVVPDLMEANYVEEMNARVGALDLEGFSMPGDGGLRRSNIAAAVYSPSVYGEEWDLRGPLNDPGATPLLRVDESWASKTSSSHTKDSSSNGTIPICYPELASDPSVGNMVSGNANSDTNNDGDDSTGRGLRPHRLSPELTWHSRTHSRDHLDSDAHSIFAQHVSHHDSQERDGGTRLYDSPGAFSHASAMVSPLHYLPATVYTPPTGESERMRERREMFGERVGRGAGHEGRAARNRVGDENESPSVKGRQKVGLASGFTIKGHSAASPTRGQDIFDTAPSLEPSTSPIQALKLQPNLSSPTHIRGRRDDINDEIVLTTDPEKPRPAPLATDTDTDTEPQPQPSHSLPDPTDKMDQMLTLLTRLSARGGDITDLQEEMRAMNRRLEGRLSAVERERELGRATPPLTPASTTEGAMSSVVSEDTMKGVLDSAAVDKARSHELGTRVSTDVARDFYRREQEKSFSSAVEQQESGGADNAEPTRGGAEAGAGVGRAESASSGSVVGSSSEGGESDSLRELKEANRKLAEMMGGFAEKLRIMEERMSREGRPGGSASGSG